MNTIIRSTAVLLLSLGLTSAATKCGGGSKCPESAPCCSAYGECGAGAYCLGGCDPRSSFNLQSCVARPTCESSNYELSSLKGMEENTVYLGDSSDTNWVVEGQPVVYNDDSVLLTMAPNTVGTLLSSAHYVWYGTISATLRTSRGQGVVTAFIMMSDVKDEIDFEFVGYDTDIAQSNFYWQGVKNYTNSKNLTSENTDTDWHTYTIDWQEDQLTWSVDGKVLRTLTRDSTLNESTGTYQYPQTPSRIQLSLWPAGLKSNGEGTVEWAGGLIDWNSQYMMNGYYYAQIKDIKVKCAPQPSGITANGDKSYIYKDDAGLQDSVEISNDDTTLASFLATGNNPGYKPKKKSSSGTSSSSPVKPSVQTVPGVSEGGSSRSGGAPVVNGNSGDDNQNSGVGGGYGSSQFHQGLQEGNGSNKGSQGKNERAMQSSFLAVLIAVFAACVI